MWEDLWAATRAVELTDSIALHAGNLADPHGLRGAGAVHLASVLAVGAGETVFAVWDQRFRAGPEAAGLTLVPEPQAPGLSR